MVRSDNYDECNGRARDGKRSGDGICVCDYASILDWESRLIST